MDYTNIRVDLDVYKALEARRSSFNETHNAILRRALSLTSPVPLDSKKSMRFSRVSGNYTLQVLGERVAVRSIREALFTTLLKVEADQPGFLENLSERMTTKGRRIVARKPEDIYSKRPQLKQYAVQLNSEWYFDTNISRRACERYLEIIGEVAGIKTPLLLDLGSRESS
jgi:hypothetical protein